jgi:chromosome segregation ATPase
MRVVLFHSDTPDEAAAAGPLVHLLGEGGHDVLNLGSSDAMDALMDVYPSARCQRVRDGGKDATAAIRAFGPDSVCVLAENDTWSVIQKSGALNGATRVGSRASDSAEYRSRCESVAEAVLGNDSVAKLRTAWRAHGLGDHAAAARAGVEAASGQIQTLCADAVSRIVQGLDRAAELKDLSRLIATLQHAIESQAADNADLQTQLEARAATIKSRDEQISLLRAQVGGLGLQLERMHRLGAELQEAHRVAGQLRERLEAIQSSDAISIPKAELEDLRSKAAQVSRLHEVGAELQRLHGIVGETRGQVSTRDAELAAARAQIEELREQVRNLHGLGAELHRVHAVAGEQKIHLEIRTARVADLQRQVDELHSQLETARRDLRESDARGSAAGTSALIEAGRAARASEAFVGVQQALIQAQAREETFRNELARARTDRDALDALVSARDAELVQVRTALDAERRARDAALGARDQARGHAAALLNENTTLRQHVRDLLASRWRKLGQRIGVAMTLPWERELREVKPGGIAPRPQEGPARAKNA